jgi:aspartyl-tRNA(Asn)/glutamyl-tRNA(Gln) amidotransferase subunit C
MSDTLDDATVRKVASLARLRLEEAEIPPMRAQLAGILDHVRHLEALDVEGVEPMAHPLDLVNRFGEDEPGPVMPTEDLLRNAPAVRGPYLDVPRVLGGESSG